MPPATAEGCGVDEERVFGGERKCRRLTRPAGFLLVWTYIQPIRVLENLREDIATGCYPKAARTSRRDDEETFAPYPAVGHASANKSLGYDSPGVKNGEREPNDEEGSPCPKAFSDNKFANNIL